jgi:ABC-type sulfate transport system permease subunit
MRNDFSGIYPATILDGIFVATPFVATPFVPIFVKFE